MSSTYSLSDFDLRSTPCRLDVLSSFQAVDFALSQGDIEQKLSEQYDRVTIYRTLKTFLSSGLLHKVLDDNGGVKYALCKELCHQGDHHHQHDQQRHPQQDAVDAGERLREVRDQSTRAAHVAVESRRHQG